MSDVKSSMFVPMTRNEVVVGAILFVIPAHSQHTRGIRTMETTKGFHFKARGRGAHPGMDTKQIKSTPKGLYHLP